MAREVVETTDLARRQESNGELQAVAAQASAQHEIQSAIVIAKRFPRSEDGAYAQLLRACERPSFAEDAAYSYPRGGTTVSGPSIYLAREFARAWGNIRHGCYVTYDDDELRTIRAWAWDMQTNTRVEAEDSFKKLIYRKGKGWIPPDERDLRELTNRRAAIAKRNCLLELLPSDMVEDALEQSRKTLADKAAKDPDAARKQIVKAFADLNVPIAELEAHLGHPLAQCSPQELATLRQTYKSIRDGNSTWRDH